MKLQKNTTMKNHSVSKIAKTMWLKFDFDPDVAICATYSFKHNKQIKDNINMYFAKMEKIDVADDITE